MPRKRAYEEVDSVPLAEPQEMSLLQKLRNMWEFSSVMQYIFIFGKAVKIDDDFDIEDFENECLRPGYSEKLEEIGLTLLKWISSHRGLNYDIWDEYTRRQYQAKAPNQYHPYGDEAEPYKFRTFDVFTKIRVLHQLTVWTFWNSDRMRQAMGEDVDDLEWRIEPLGWDEDEREYYVLDDNRLYRRTEPPLPATPKAKPKYTSKKAQANRRRTKRRRIESSEPEVEMNTENEGDETNIESSEHQEGNGSHQVIETDPTKIDTLGGFKWECIAITLEEYQDFCNSIKKTRDPNQKTLWDNVVNNVLPTLEQAAERQKRKIERRQKELLVLEKLATAKRSSRLADKQDRERREADAFEMERKRAADLAAAHREQQRQQQMEEDRQSRMMTREQRIKDREFKRLLKEEELARDAEEQKKIEEGEARGSARHLKERIEKNKKELEEMADDDWTFDCSGCGIHGKNIDDGSHSVACERCNVWQHSKCLKIPKSAAEKDDFHFVCRDCRRKEEDAKKPKISLKFRVGQSSSPVQAPASPTTLRSPSTQRIAVVVPPLNGQARSPSQVPYINGQFHPQPSPGPVQYPAVSPAAFVIQPSAPDITNRHLPSSSPIIAPPRNTQNHQDASNGAPSNIQPINSTTNSVHYHNPPPQIQQPPHPSYPRPNPSDQASQQQFIMHSTPYSTSSRSNGTSATPNGRLPSPVLNPPTMSPTQGNHDVGPIAGVPGTSPISYHATLSNPQQNGIPFEAASPTMNETNLATGQISRHSSPSSSIHHQTQPFSGLSPIKQRTMSPLPRPSNIPQKMSMSPPAPNSNALVMSNYNGTNTQSSSRTVSGTPIFPPAEKLAPSPEHVRNTPVPTPSKQPTPAKVGEASFREYEH